MPDAVGAPSVLRFLESRPALRYASAPAAAALSAGVQYALLPAPSIAPFVVALVAWLAGRGPGLLTVLLSALAGNWLFLPPQLRLSLSGPDLTATLLFLVGAGAVALLCAQFRRALLASQRGAAELRRQAALLRRSTEAARESEARFRTLADNISQLAWMADEQGSIFWCRGSPSCTAGPSARTAPARGSARGSSSGSPSSGGGPHASPSWEARPRPLRPGASS
jgi:PAS domain-containing protein